MQLQHWTASATAAQAAAADPPPGARVSDPNGSAPKMDSFKCEHVSGGAVVNVKAGREREVSAAVSCSRGVGLMSELC
ncbi:hypothetical protein QQF64_010229 [Cirrhinus molitorella]|uniref:Uncharacterized protein n=1 Tax=Cirrhinus molitorella TaxID=172907 RepID=A0ABR3M3D7_9TELE